MDITRVQRIIRLSQNENSFGPSPLAVKVVLKHYDKMSLYPEPHSQSLKAKIAKKFDRGANHVFVSAGLVESLDILIRNFVSEDENIVIPEISFMAYRLLAKVFEKEVRFAPMKNYRLDVDQLLNLCNEKNQGYYNR